MKTRTLGLVALLAAGTLILTGCNNSETTSEIENEGTTNIIEEVENTENHENQLTETEQVFIPDEESFAKTALTLKELDEIINNHFPKSYIYTTYNFETEKSTSGEENYPEGSSVLIPELEKIKTREILSSEIKDDLIYTSTKVVLKNGTELDVGYVVNPINLEIIAASVENETDGKYYKFEY